MELFFEFFKFFGLNVTENSNIFVLFLVVILILNIIALLCIFNILLYVGVIYLFNDKNSVDWFLGKCPLFLRGIIKKLLFVYKSSSKYFILIEVLLLLVSLCSVIWILLNVIVKLQ
jgi:hypothetical protein